MKNKINCLSLCFIIIISYSLNSAPLKKNQYNIIKISKLLKGLELFLPRLILRNKEKLQLSLKQNSKIEAEILSYEKFIIKNGAEIKITELEVVFLLSSEPVNREKIFEKIRSSGKLKTKSFLKHLNHLFNIKDILTPKQIKLLIKGQKQ